MKQKKIYIIPLSELILSYSDTILQTRSITGYAVDNWDADDDNIIPIEEQDDDFFIDID